MVYVLGIYRKKQKKIIYNISNNDIKITRLDKLDQNINVPNFRNDN
jgi:hypothetical protein